MRGSSFRQTRKVREKKNTFAASGDFQKCLQLKMIFVRILNPFVGSKRKSCQDKGNVNLENVKGFQVGNHNVSTCVCVCVCVFPLQYPAG